MPKSPSIIVTVLIVGTVPVLQYFIANTKSFGLSDAIAPTLVIVATALITILQQWKASTEPVATARGLEQAKQKSFVARVLVG